MADTNMFIQSLCNRIRAMNILWERAISDMSLEQVNHHERDGVLPIAFSFSHFMRGQDRSVSRVFLGESPLWESGGWATKVGVTVNAFGREESVEEMQQLRFGDLSAWKLFQEQVLERTARALETITAPMLAEVVMPQLPPSMQNLSLIHI